MSFIDPADGRPAIPRDVLVSVVGATHAAGMGVASAAVAVVGGALAHAIAEFWFMAAMMAATALLLGSLARGLFRTSGLLATFIPRETTDDR